MSMASPESLVCNRCRVPCASAELLQEHIAVEHMWSAVTCFECAICQTLFRQRQEVISHIKKVHYKSNGLEAEPESSLTEAEKKTTEDCPLCEMPFASTEAVQAHIRSQECPEILKESSTTVLPTPANIEKCSHCKKTYSDPHALRVHIDTDHLSCSDCGSVCMDEAQFYTHLMSCSASQNNSNATPSISSELGAEKCHFCGDTFSCQASLEAHLSSNHFTVKCTQCSSAFQNEAGLKAHMAGSHQQKSKKIRRPDSANEKDHMTKNRRVDSSISCSSSSSRGSGDHETSRAKSSIEAKNSHVSQSGKRASNRSKESMNNNFEMLNCPGKCPICELPGTESELAGHIIAEHE